MHKIIFLTFLQVFYQNIKHRDGKADIFDPPHPYPPLKKFIIDIEAIKLNFYEYVEGSSSMRMSYINQHNMVVFASYKARNININYKQLGT